MAADRGWTLKISGGQVVATDVEIAGSIWRRALGLMFRGAIADDYGLVLKPCSSIHMFFMRIPIDVLFVDGDGKVVRVVDSIPPWRLTLPVRRSRAAIELRAGTARKFGIEAGTRVELSKPG